eukprot:933464_1
MKFYFYTTAFILRIIRMTSVSDNFDRQVTLCDSGRVVSSSRAPPFSFPSVSWGKAAIFEFYKRLSRKTCVVSMLKTLSSGLRRRWRIGYSECFGDFGENGTKKEGRNHCNSKVSRHRKYIQSDQNFNLIKPDADLPKKSSLSQKIFDASHIGSTWDSSSTPDPICTLPRSRSEPKFSLESPCHESMLPPLQSLPPPNTPCSSIDQPFSSPVPSLFQAMSDQSWSPGGMSIQSPGFGSSPVPFGVSMHLDIETQVAMSTSMATSFHPHSDSPTPLQPFNMWFHPLLAPPGINPGFGLWPAVPTGISGLPVPGISLPPLPHSLGGDILGSLNMGDYEAGVRRMNSCSPNNFESNSFESAVC